jgi:hypothetical protein
MKMEKTHGHFKQNNAVVHVANDSINALTAVFDEWVTNQELWFVGSPNSNSCGLHSQDSTLN